MNVAARTAGLAVLGSCVALGPLDPPLVGGQTRVERITTDTPEYCLHLLERLHEAEHGRPPPQAVALLSDEGQLMCEHGQPRPGILRLRRAMQIMLGTADDR